MRTLRAAILLALLAVCPAALAQERDFSLTILEGGVPFSGGEVVYALVVGSNYWTIEKEPFVVRLTVPPALEPTTARCNGESGEIHFDPSPRVLTWSARLDNEVLAQKSCPLTFRVVPTFAPGTPFSLSAALETSAPDPNPANNAASYTSFVLAASDLEVQSSANEKRLQAGELITYTFTVANRGPQHASDVTIVNHLSPNVTFVSFERLGGAPAVLDDLLRESGTFCPVLPCGKYIEARVPLMQNGTQTDFKLVVRTDPAVEAADVVSRVVAQSTSIDPSRHNNDMAVVAFVGPDAELGLVASRGAEEPGLQTPVTLEVFNSGPHTVRNVTVSNALRDTGSDWTFVSKVKFLRATSSQGTCAPPELTEIVSTPPLPPFWTLECAVGTLAQGERATITIVVERSPRTELTLSSFVGPSQNDPFPSNNARELSLPLMRRRATR